MAKSYDWYEQQLLDYIEELEKSVKSLKKRLKARPLAVTAEVVKVIDKAYDLLWDAHLNDGVNLYNKIISGLEAMPDPEPTEKAEPVKRYGRARRCSRQSPPADLLALVDEAKSATCDKINKELADNTNNMSIAGLGEVWFYEELKRLIAERGVKPISVPSNIEELIDGSYERSLDVYSKEKNIAADEPIEYFYQEINAALRRQETAPCNKCKELGRWVNDLQSGMYINCVYCGHRYGPKEDTPSSRAEVLKKHIEQCPEHPLFHAKQEIAELKRLIAEHGGAAPASPSLEELAKQQGVKPMTEERLRELGQSGLDFEDFERPDHSAAPAFDARELLMEFETWERYRLHKQYRLFSQTTKDMLKRYDKGVVDKFLKDNPVPEARPPWGFSIEQVRKTMRKYHFDSDTERVIKDLKALEAKEPPPTYGMSKERVKWLFAEVDTNIRCELPLDSKDTRQTLRNFNDAFMDAVDAADIPEPPAVKPNKCPDECCFKCEFCKVGRNGVVCFHHNKEGGEVCINSWILRGCIYFTPIKEGESE